jgi:GAF domain-containing protein
LGFALVLVGVAGQADEADDRRAVGLGSDATVPDGRPLDHDAVARLIADVDVALGVEQTVVCLREPGNPRSVVVVGALGAPPGLIGQRFGSDEGMVGQVLATGRPVLASEVGRGVWAVGHWRAGEHYAGALVPIRDRGVVHGALCIASSDPGRRFSADELDTLQRLARDAASALEDARRVTRHGDAQRAALAARRSSLGGLGAREEPTVRSRAD